MNIRRFARSSFFVAALTCSLMPPVIHARSTELVEPPPVTINCNLPADKMKEGIMRGGAVRGWMVVSQTPGNTELKYIKGNNKHIITVNVKYTANSFAITYKDSVNLNYEVTDDGTRRLHPRPIGWMTNLSGDIRVATNNFCHG